MYGAKAGAAIGAAKAVATGAATRGAARTTGAATATAGATKAALWFLAITWELVAVTTGAAAKKAPGDGAAMEVATSMEMNKA